MIDRIVNKPADPVSILLLGDIILDLPDADFWLGGIAPLTRAADVVIGHLEVPHSETTEEVAGDIPAPAADPAALAALARAGFTAMSLAGNHIADCGARGIADTIAELDRLGIRHAGAGVTLNAARAPAWIATPQGEIALLSYNCVGPELSWAGADKAGCAYLRIATADGAPIAPTAALAEVTDEARAVLAADIAAVRGRAALVIIALHKGIVHRPAALAPYERAIARAAIDAGADVVVGHHAHIARGIEIHCGKPVFHGLGNGCVVTAALSPDQSHPARAEWARRREALFGFAPDPAYRYAPFHPDAVNAMVGRVLWHADGRIAPGIVPVHVEPPGRPVLADAARAPGIAGYVAAITRDAGLPPIGFEARDGMWALK